MKKIFTNKIVVALVAMLCCALWGSAFPVIKIGYKFFNISGVDTASQILFAGVRFLIAGFLTILLGSIFADKFIVIKSVEIVGNSKFQLNNNKILAFSCVDIKWIKLWKLCITV